MDKNENERREREKRAKNKWRDETKEGHGGEAGGIRMQIDAVTHDATACESHA